MHSFWGYDVIPGKSFCNTQAANVKFLVFFGLSDFSWFPDNLRRTPYIFFDAELCQVTNVKISSKWERET